MTIELVGEIVGGKFERELVSIRILATLST